MDHTLLVLGLLKLQEMHGYQLNDLIDRRLKYITDLKKPTLYHLLDRLEKLGEVAKSASREGNRPERYTFRLTPLGAEHFQELLAQNLQDAHTAYFSDDLGLLFLNEIPVRRARPLLENKRALVAERLAWIRHAVAQHRPDTPAFYTLHHHELHLETELAWLGELLERLKAGTSRQNLLACLASTDLAPMPQNMTESE